MIETLHSNDNNPCGAASMRPVGGQEIIHLKNQGFTAIPNDKTPVNQRNRDQVLNEFFQSEIAASRSKATALARRKAMTSFENFLQQNGKNLLKDSFGYDELNGWVLNFFLEGGSPTTILHYLKHLSALYSRALETGLVDDTEAFSKIIATVRDLPVAVAVINPEFISRLRTLLSAPASLPRDISLTAIFAGGITFNSLAELTADAPIPDVEILNDIKNRYTKRGRKHLFQLNQSGRSKNRVYTCINTIFSATTLLDHRLTPADAWAHIALTIGIEPSVIIAITGGIPASAPFLSLVKPATLTESEKLKIIVRVANSFIAETDEWYAIQYRPKTAHSQVMSRINTLHDNTKILATYYPCADIAKRLGKKIVTQRRPIVDGLLFIKCRNSHISSVLRQISDLAWCYRVSGSNSPYAIIPHEQIRQYQLAIGILTPEITPVEAGNIQLQPGDKVKVIGGIFSGRTATLDEVNTNPNGATIYRLLLPGQNSIEWRTSDPRLFIPALT